MYPLHCATSLINFIRCPMRKRTSLVSITSIASSHIIFNVTGHAPPVQVLSKTFFRARHALMTYGGDVMTETHYVIPRCAFCIPWVTCLAPDDTGNSHVPSGNIWITEYIQKSPLRKELPQKPSTLSGGLDSHLVSEPLSVLLHWMRTTHPFIR